MKDNPVLRMDPYAAAHSQLFSMEKLKGKN